MSSVKGRFQDGVARPLEPVEDARDGQEVIIIFLDEQPAPLTDGEEWSALDDLLAKCAMETGISDLAREHDHYLYGKPKMK